MHPIEITDANFEQEVVKSDVPVLIDFWAVWCGPCKMIAPFVEQLAGEYQGKVKVGKVDVDNNPNISMQFGIRSIPTLLVFNGGKVVDQIIGAVPKQTIAQKLDAQLQTV
jgi:thioredoxin 1